MISKTGWYYKIDINISIVKNKIFVLEITFIERLITNSLIDVMIGNNCKYL